MITTYHRPQTLEETLALLAQPNTLPLGGGTELSHASSAPHKHAAPLPFGHDVSARENIEVVDLQALGLDTLSKSGNTLELGATLTLQALLASEHCPAALKSALKLEAPLNIRNSATVAGTLVAGDGRSTFASVLLALDAKISVSSQAQAEETLNIGDFLPLREQVRGKLITKITFPNNTKLAFEYVARTPSDKPIVCVAVAGWGSGRTRVAVGGYGKSPMLSMDGAASADDLVQSAQTAVRNSFHEATDPWGSAEYRMDVAATLVQRCLAAFSE